MLDTCLNYPGRVHESVVVHCCCNLKGNFHTIRSPGCPASEAGGCPQILYSRNYSGGTDLDLPMEQYIYKRKRGGIYIINLKRSCKLLLAPRAIVALENLANVNVPPPRNPGQVSCAEVAGAPGTTPIAGCPAPGTFPDQVQAAFWEPGLLGVLNPKG